MLVPSGAAPAAKSFIEREDNVGIFAVSNELAIGAMYVTKELKKEEDVSFVCFGTREDDEKTPSTMVSIQWDEIGRESVKALVSIINNQTYSNVIFQPKIND